MFKYSGDSDIDIDKEDITSPRKNGRPSKYDPSYIVQVEKLSKLGATIDEIADFIGVSKPAIQRWAVEHDEFRVALKIGKEASDERVVRSLFHRAVGFQNIVRRLTSDGQIVEIEETVLPETTAMIFWLKNRRPDEWRERKSDDNDRNIQPIINVNLPGPQNGSSD